MDKVNGSKTRSGARLMDYDECKNIGFYHGHNRHGSQHIVWSKPIEALS